MATTTTYAWSTPDLPDPADGPAQFKELADGIEHTLTVGTLKMSGGVIEANSPTANPHPVTLAWYKAHVVIGPAASAPAAGGLPDGSMYLGT